MDDLLAGYVLSRKDTPMLLDDLFTLYARKRLRDRAERLPSIDPGWRIAWLFDCREFVWDGMTFGRHQDAERAVESMYSLDDWDCGCKEECKMIALKITEKKIRNTILEWMAW